MLLPVTSADWLIREDIGALALAQSADEASATDWPQGGSGVVAIERGVPALDGLLFVGTCTNINDPAATVNDVFTLDPGTNVSTSVLTGVQSLGGDGRFCQRAYSVHLCERPDATGWRDRRR